MCNFSKLNANLTPRSIVFLEEDWLQLLSAHIYDVFTGPPHGWVNQRRPWSGSFQREWWLGDTQGGKAGGQWGREEGEWRKAGYPSPTLLKLKGAGVQKTGNELYQKCPFHTHGGMALPSELFCGHCLICAQALISSNLTAVATEALEAQNMPFLSTWPAVTKISQASLVAQY